MRTSILALTLVWWAFAMSACVPLAHGPSDNITDANYVQSVQAVVDKEETIKFMDKAYMLANTAMPGPAQTWGVFGTIVVTNKTLYFLFWNRNENTFDILRKLSIIDIVNSKPISSMWGPGEYIAIEDKDHRFDLFSCYEDNMIEKNRELMDCLNAVKNAE